MIKDSYPSLKLQRDEDLLTITIDRPDALNAINDVVMQSLHSVFTDLRDEASLRGVRETKHLQQEQISKRSLLQEILVPGRVHLGTRLFV